MAASAIAFHGGKPTFPDGPPRWPPVWPEVQAELDRVYQDGYWGNYHGPYTERLRDDLSQLLQVQHTHLCCSGTVAVELALRGLRVGAGDEVVLCGYDFGGNFRAIESIGATPVLADTLPQGFCIDTALLPRIISPSTRVILVSHMHGQLVDMQEVMRFARQHDLLVVEDACQAPGATHPLGQAGTAGDVGVLSFGGSKLLTAGRGGAIFTNDDQIAQRVRLAAERGNDAFALSQLQAAALIPQLPRLAERNELRLSHARRLLKQLGDIPQLLPLPLNQTSYDGTALYKVPFHLRTPEVPRERLIAAVQAEGIALDSGFRGFAKRSARRCRKPLELPHAADAANHSLLLHHPVLLEQAEIIDRLAARLRLVVESLVQEKR